MQNLESIKFDGQYFSNLILPDDVIQHISIVSLREMLSLMGADDMMKSRIMARRRCLKSRAYAEMARRRHHQFMANLVRIKQRLRVEKVLLLADIGFYKDKIESSDESPEDESSDETSNLPLN